MDHLHGKVVAISSTVFMQLLAVPYHGTLLRVLRVFLNVLGDTQAEILSGHRPGDTGPHGMTPCMALDLNSTMFSPPDRQIITDKVNERFEYDPAVPGSKVMVIRDTGRGPHFHIQVGPNTVEKPAPAPAPPSPEGAPTPPAPPVPPDRGPDVTPTQGDPGGAVV